MLEEMAGEARLNDTGAYPKFVEMEGNAMNALALYDTTDTT
jgi:hypothetical protein